MKSNILCCQKLFPREQNGKKYNSAEMKMPILDFFTLKLCPYKQPVVKCKKLHYYHQKILELSLLSLTFKNYTNV